MADAQVTCITKPNRNSAYEAITHLGGVNWRWPAKDVIASIEAKTNTFYTLAAGKRADVGVVNGPHGKYLRTHADNQWNDNLLALAECP